jgi:hypothetical protein
LVGTIPSEIGRLVALNTILCVAELLVSGAHTRCPNEQAIGQQSDERNDTAIDWAIDGACAFVRRVTGVEDASFALIIFFCNRAMNNNLLTGTIPPTIGQLTALTYLYVVRNKPPGRVVS